MKNFGPPGGGYSWRPLGSANGINILVIDEVSTPKCSEMNNFIRQCGTWAFFITNWFLNYSRKTQYTGEGG